MAVWQNSKACVRTGVQSTLPEGLYSFVGLSPSADCTYPRGDMYVLYVPSLGWTFLPQRSSQCEVLYSGSDSDTPRHRRRGRFRDESDKESSRISDRDVPLGRIQSSRRNDYNVELEDLIDLCSEVSSKHPLLTSAIWGTRVLLVAG